MRPVEAFPFEQDGEFYICLRDVDGYLDKQVLLTPAAFFVACLLDGEHDAAGIQQEFAAQMNGQLLPIDDIEEVVRLLDGYCLLETQAFDDLQKQVHDEFAAAPGRPAWLAGKGYPDDPAELRAFLDELYTLDKSPGRKPAATAGDGPAPACLVAPHIDFHRGGHSYAHAYLRLHQSGAPDTVIVFGTAHASPPAPFVLTRKDYETPLGPARTDVDLVDRLAAACDWDPFEFELVHRTEHSIEFQALMLRHLYGDAVRIVPILCGAYFTDPAYYDDPVGRTPAELSGVNRFFDVLAEILAERKGRATVIAAADLAHVGRRFGDELEIDDDAVEAVRVRDEEDLELARRGEHENFYQSVMKDANARRVCGLNCIYATLRATEGLRDEGKLLHYDYAEDPAGGIVSFTSMLWQAKAVIQDSKFKMQDLQQQL